MHFSQLYRVKYIVRRVMEARKYVFLYRSILLYLMISYIVETIVLNDKLRNPNSTPTFKTEALPLVSNVQLDKCLLACNEKQIQH